MRMSRPPQPFIGVLSDTHGYYDVALDDLLAGAEHIVHAGDIGTLDVLSRLRAIAPVTAVLGNTDLPFWDDALPWETEVVVLGQRILVGHIGKSLMGRHDPVAEGFDLVVSGHSHKAAVEWRERTLFLDPGAAGKARFGMPRTLALVTVGADGRPAPEIVPLGV
jgi:putative phosphoesterase